MATFTFTKGYGMRWNIGGLASRKGPAAAENKCAYSLLTKYDDVYITALINKTAIKVKNILANKTKKN